jgi:cell division protein FtsL
MRKINKKNRKKGKRALFLAFWCMLALFIGVAVFMTVQTSLAGVKLAKLEEEETLIEKQKREYLSEYAKLSSVTAILEKAEKMGYIKPQNIIYLSDGSAIAKLP